jgi:hypothetical protein
MVFQSPVSVSCHCNGGCCPAALFQGVRGTSTGARPGENQVSNGVLAVAVVLAAVAIICILVSTVAVLLLRRAVDARAMNAAFYSDTSSDVGRAFPIGPGVSPPAPHH